MYSYESSGGIRFDLDEKVTITTPGQEIKINLKDILEFALDLPFEEWPEIVLETRSIGSLLSDERG